MQAYIYYSLATSGYKNHVEGRTFHMRDSVIFLCVPVPTRWRECVYHSVHGLEFLFFCEKKYISIREISEKVENTDLQLLKIMIIVM